MPLMAIPATGAAPLHWRRVFPGGLEQVARARRFVACLLDGCPYLDDVLLAADELAANALRHTRSGQDGGSFTVEVLRCDGQVAVSVADQGGPGVPVPADASEWAETGRGLRTLALLADTWGWHGNAEGRTVTAVFTEEKAA
ncbi:ATP-binding protein [Actinomadura keratinilytica]|jgi:anti-sigma regulatory factor (Ser/Thr protein kinase)|uniref:Histidine kinase/HSP90-like ATPase domain-containing protein n=2 Tax=Actinomadura keratinilytica TaxID=547461 RepID=A0ABP7Z4E6_9ACTN